MFSIELALTLGCIWTLRKKAAHKDSHFNIPIAIQGLELRFSEHLSILVMKLILKLQVQDGVLLPLKSSSLILMQPCEIASHPLL